MEYYGVMTLGRRGVNFITRLGGVFVMLGRFIVTLKDIPRSMRLIFEQLYAIGVQSLPLILVIAIFVGAVSAWQAAYQFKFIGAPLRYLGQAVGKAVVIELAPVLSALVFAGRVGAGIAAELGTMRVTEQIDALEIMGVNSASYLILPKIIATLIFNPILTLLSIIVGIAGGWIAGRPGSVLKP